MKIKITKNEVVISQGEFSDGILYVTKFIKGDAIFPVLESKIELKYNYLTNKSEGTMIENGKEYFVEYENGEELIGSKRRTFEGIRLMIIGYLY